jgi:hypothetical protein
VVSSRASSASFVGDGTDYSKLVKQMPELSEADATVIAILIVGAAIKVSAQVGSWTPNQFCENLSGGSLPTVER